MTVSTQRVVPVRIGSPMHERFKKHQRSNQPINYCDIGSGEARAKYNINHSKQGLPGDENFYLTRLGF